MESKDCVCVRYCFIVLYMKCLCCRDYANDQTTVVKTLLSFTTLGAQKLSLLSTWQASGKIDKDLSQKTVGLMSTWLSIIGWFLLPNVL